MVEREGGGIFVSYRRQEGDLAGRLADYLMNRFGEGRVFLDVDAIEPGADFFEIIARELESCKVMLVIIGPQWLTETDDQGRPRLENDGDLVRLEIDTALARDVRVIPILMRGAVMPREQDLPTSLHGLSRRNAFVVHQESFRSDADRLATSIEPTIRMASQTQNVQERDSRPTGEHWALPPDDPELSSPPIWHYRVLANIGGGPISLEGGPISANEEAEYLALQPPAQYANRDDIFVIRASGDSMTEDGVLDGDYLVVIRDSQATDGDMVIVAFDEEATVKRFYRDGAAIRLESSNPSFSPLILQADDQVVILGKVIGLLRWHINKAYRSEYE